MCTRSTTILVRCRRDWCPTAVCVQYVRKKHYGKISDLKYTHALLLRLPTAYRESEITSDGKNSREINQRIVIGKNSFRQNSNNKGFISKEDAF